MESCTHTALRTTVVLRFFSFLVLSFLFSFSTSANHTFLYRNCPNPDHYQSNSLFRVNLNTLLSSLSADSNNTSANGYNNKIIGESPNTVYGQYYCRGDVSRYVCRDCVNYATATIAQICPNSNEASIGYDECTLRYSNQTLFFNITDSFAMATSNMQNTSDPIRFKQLLVETMNQTTTEAVSVSHRFATRVANFTQSHNLYCLAQCSPDLSENICNKCLVSARASLFSYWNGKKDGRVLNANCGLRYALVTEASAPALPPPPEKQRRSSKKIVTIVVPIAATGVILLPILDRLLKGLSIRKKKMNPKANDNNVIITSESLQFDLRTILAATESFSMVNKIGGGGFGDVYKGELPNGQEIAVKRLSKCSGQGAKEFKNEVLVVAKLQHRNLVRLLGFCLEGEEKILVYEFVPNRSLDYFLFDPEKRIELDWKRRYKIIEGIARGLLYLHEDSRLRIIHRDLKTSNILLDGEMNPKISDFGTARIVDMGQGEEKTNRIVGTYGHMSPEYAMRGQFSVKSDVYSLGVSILEILSGMEALECRNNI